MVSKLDATRAAGKVFTQCLALPRQSNIVVFTDETTFSIASLLTECALELDLLPSMLCFSTQIQLNTGSNGLTSSVETLLDEAVAALVCLNGTSACLPFRDHVRQLALNAGCKVAHMPGITMDTLLLADADYMALSAQCELLALALAKGQELTIITKDNQGNKHILKVPLQSWQRLPIISDGIIQKNSWGNVPSGETYIAPPEGLSEGSIVIDGSLPDHPFAKDEIIILHFQAGRLVNWNPKESPSAQHLLQTQIDFARNRGDKNWNNLAEIGLGVNPLVKTLTGIPLLDEKKIGSLHVALGDNIDMGGQSSSQIHCDMVTISPTVLIDGKIIIDNGTIVIRAENWLEDHRTITVPDSWRSTTMIAATATEAHVGITGMLQRSWDTSSGRVCSVQVGNNSTSRLATNVYQTLESRGQPVTIEELASQELGLTLPEVLQLTHLLHQYELIKVLESCHLG